MLGDLMERYKKKPLFTSDELTHYESVLAELFHTASPVEPTGKPGRPRNPRKVLDEDLDYATVHKTRENGHIVNVERTVVFGSEERIPPIFIAKNGVSLPRVSR
jgi:hypothetical protein